MTAGVLRGTLLWSCCQILAGSTAPPWGRWVDGTAGGVISLPMFDPIDGPIPVAIEVDESTMEWHGTDDELEWEFPRFPVDLRGVVTLRFTTNALRVAGAAPLCGVLEFPLDLASAVVGAFAGGISHGYHRRARSSMLLRAFDDGSIALIVRDQRTEIRATAREWFEACVRCARKLLAQVCERFGEYSMEASRARTAYAAILPELRTFEGSSLDTGVRIQTVFDPLGDAEFFARKHSGSYGPNARFELWAGPNGPHWSLCTGFGAPELDLAELRLVADALRAGKRQVLWYWREASVSLLIVCRGTRCIIQHPRHESTIHCVVDELVRALDAVPQRVIEHLLTQVRTQAAKDWVAFWTEEPAEPIARMETTNGWW